MNIQKNVNQRLAKIYTKDTKQELSAEKVELGLLQDIESDYNFVLKDFSNTESKFYDALGTASSNQKFIVNDLNKLEKIQKDISNAKSKLKEIGLDNQVAQLNKISTKVNEMIKSAMRIKNIKL
jgi:hypothetical protein